LCLAPGLASAVEINAGVIESVSGLSSGAAPRAIEATSLSFSPSAPSLGALPAAVLSAPAPLAVPSAAAPALLPSAAAPAPASLSARGIQAADAGPKGNVIPKPGLGGVLKSLLGFGSARLPRLENTAMTTGELIEAADFTAGLRRTMLKESGTYTDIQADKMREVRRVQNAMLLSAAALHAKSGGAPARVVEGRSDPTTPGSYYYGLKDSAKHNGLLFSGDAAKPATLIDKLARFARKNGYAFLFDPAQTNFNSLQAFVDTRAKEAVFNAKIITDLIRGVLPATVLHEYAHLRSRARVETGRTKAFDGVQIQNASGRDPASGYPTTPLPGADDYMNTRPYGAGFSADEVLARKAEVDYHRARLAKAATAAQREEISRDLAMVTDELDSMARMTKEAIAGMGAAPGRFYEGHAATERFRGELGRVEFDAELPGGRKYRVRVELPPSEFRPEGFDALVYARTQLDRTLAAAAIISP
jgi:hypothetical protein